MQYGDAVTYVKGGNDLNALVLSSREQPEGEALSLLYLDAEKVAHGFQLRDSAVVVFSVMPVSAGSPDGWVLPFQPPAAVDPFEGMEATTLTGLIVGKHDPDTGFLFKPADPEKMVDVKAAQAASELVEKGSAPPALEAVSITPALPSDLDTTVETQAADKSAKEQTAE